MTRKTPAPNSVRAVSAYLAKVADFRRQGNATEHTYRPALAELLESFFPPPEWRIVNEPARQACGAPDLAVEKNGAAVGFIETKDIGADLDAESESAQLKRYRAALPNLVLTDYVDFRHYADNNLRDTLRIAAPEAAAFRRITDGVKKLPGFFQSFADCGDGALGGRGDSPSAEQLAKLMAGKARLLRELVFSAAKDEKSELNGVFQTFERVLIRGLKLHQFADIFAQTAVYGIFAARLEAENRGVSTRQFDRAAAGQLLPQTTPFLRRFFNSFAGPDMDSRIEWMADHIAAMFATMSLDNVARAFAVGGGQADDPFLHFYETFLREYDPKKRAARGVYFTPRPVVDFIVRAVDDSLKSNFAIRNGLADESMALCNGEEIPRVQILDPAAGTGAFLARIAELIRERVCRTGGEGAWPEYIREHLLPRLNGFENMASAYAMCHLKMALTIGEKAVAELTESIRRGDGRRVNVFLTDALQMPGEDMGKITVLHWLWEEARVANQVKTDKPVMVVIGNPPYNARSTNRGKWIVDKVEDYRIGLKGNINTAPLGDDYVKFIRCAEYFIEKNGCGIVAMITNNSFYDGAIYRRMRRHLLGTFDEIRILNLRGDSNRGDRALDNASDENVFAIRQGVGISIMSKFAEKAERQNAKVFYASIQGAREMKYEFLSRESIGGVKWQEYLPLAPHYFFIPMDCSAMAEYDAGVSLADLFHVCNTGIQTKCDSLSIHFDTPSLKTVVDNFVSLDIPELREKYPQKRDSNGWTFNSAKAELKAGQFIFADVHYRPFDIRKTVYTGRSGGFIGRSSPQTMQHIIGRENVGIIAPRTCGGAGGFSHGLVSKHIVDIKCGDNYSGNGTYLFPLWVWEEEVGKVAIRRANVRRNIAEEFAKRMGMRYSESKSGPGMVSPEALFDYIYATLHRPSYRRKFAEFLRIDFPRIPPASDESEFRRLAKLGGRLRALHLLEAPELDDAGFPFSAEGENIVENVSFAPDKESDGATGRVVINKAGRHFAEVPRVAWDFCVGGYYPAQKWLKDRKGRSLSYDDQRHYRRMLSALARTAGLVGDLDGE